MEWSEWPPQYQEFHDDEGLAGQHTGPRCSKEMRVASAAVVNSPSTFRETSRCDRSYVHYFLTNDLMPNSYRRAWLVRAGALNPRGGPLVIGALVENGRCGTGNVIIITHSL